MRWMVGFSHGNIRHSNCIPWNSQGRNLLEAIWWFRIRCTLQKILPIRELLSFPYNYFINKKIIVNWKANKKFYLTGWNTPTELSIIDEEKPEARKNQPEKMKLLRINKKLCWNYLQFFWNIVEMAKFISPF